MKLINSEIDSFKKNFKLQTNAQLFWKGLTYVAFIILAFVNLEVFACLSLIGSLFLFATSLDYNRYNDKDEDSEWWYPLTLLYWVIFVIVIIGECFYRIGKFVYYNTIQRFNDWLNSKGKGEKL